MNSELLETVKQAGADAWEVHENKETGCLCSPIGGCMKRRQNITDRRELTVGGYRIDVEGRRKN